MARLLYHCLYSRAISHLTDKHVNKKIPWLDPHASEESSDTHNAVLTVSLI